MVAGQLEERDDAVARMLARQRTNQGYRERPSYVRRVAADARVLGRNRTPGKSSRVVVDGVHHDETGCGNLPGGNCLSQCLGEKHCANAFSLL